MIISFLLGNELIQCRVDKDRVLSMRGRMTNDQWISFEELVTKSGQDGRAALITQKIVRSTGLTDEEIEFFIRDEFLRTPGLKGLEYVKTAW